MAYIGVSLTRDPFLRVFRIRSLYLWKLPTFSRMRSRRVPVLKLGSRGPGGDARSLRLCSQSVRKRSQAFAEGSDMPESPKSS